jgi:type I restriction enzyme S subunit
MDLKTFLENFDAIAEAPSGIQKLRSLILDLAVRGKLVPQNPEDEPASNLFKKLILEKEQLLKEKKFLKSEKLAPITPKDLHCSIPDEWILTRIGVICGSIVPNRDKPKTFSGGFPWITLSNFDEKGIKLLANHSGLGLSQEEVIEFNARIIPSRSVLMSCVGRFGLVAVLEQDVVTNQQIHGFVIPSGLCPEYVAYIIKAHTKFLESSATSTTVSYLNKTRCESIPFPLPPLAEQKRIVEKVDELMGLCDRLSSAKQTRDNLRQKLRESAITSLMNAETDEVLDAAWAFVRDNWHNVSQGSEDIDSLRQTLLHLAVRGKLVPQNPDDEPVEKLLKVIATKHASEAKKFRKPKDLPSLKDVEKPFELPLGWSWCRFTEIGQLDRGKSKHRPRNDSILYENGSIPLVQTGDVARANGVIETYTALYNNQGLAQSRLWSKGTLCITIAANIGDSAILGFDACFPDSIVGFLPTKPISDSRYFEFFIRTLKSRLEDFAPSTAQKNINLGILDEVLIPLPPLAEQKRIVAKVDELMKLCDQLEESLHLSQQRAESLAASAISHLTI